jgi:hypothetical protein
MGSVTWALGPAKVATCQKRPDHLADEQWVAAGDVVDPGHHRRGRRPTGQPSHVGAHLRAAEASQPDPAPDPRQVAEHLRQLVDAGLGAAVRADDHDALVGHRLGKGTAPGPRGGPRFGVRAPDLYMVREEHTV